MQRQFSTYYLNSMLTTHNLSEKAAVYPQLHDKGTPITYPNLLIYKCSNIHDKEHFETILFPFRIFTIAGFDPPPEDDTSFEADAPPTKPPWLTSMSLIGVTNFYLKKDYQNLGNTL